MPDAIRVEPMVPADGEAVLAIYAEGIATGDATFETAAPDWTTWDAAHRPDCRLVARDGAGRVVGWAAVSQVSARAVYRGVVEESVYIAAAARGQGVGAQLLAALIEATERSGIWTIQTGIFPENGASLRLHERAGFRRVGVRERVGRDVTGRWRDVVFLERRSDRVG
jgi:L-amino acid N-acyltransferase YncA